MRVLSWCHFTDGEAADEMRFEEAVQVLKVSIVPKGISPHPKQLEFKSLTQRESFALEMFYESVEGMPKKIVPGKTPIPDGTDRLYPRFQVSGGATCQTDVYAKKLIFLVTYCVK